jgi:hypothetical protein
MKNLGLWLLVGFPFLFFISDVNAQSIAHSVTTPLNGKEAFHGQAIVAPLAQQFYSDTLLPKTIESFAKNTLVAKKKGNIISLEWSNEPGVVSSVFEIERSSDGKAFQKIGELASENENANFPYLFVDHNPLTVNLYRLKVINDQGAFAYTKELMVNQVGASYSSVQPNPFNQSFTIEVFVASPQPIKVQLLDMSGRLLRYKSLAGIPGINKVEFDDLGNLRAGIYMVRIVKGNSVIEKRIVKNN